MLRHRHPNGWKVIMGRKSIFGLVWLVLLLPFYAPSVYPHEGDLDSYGCHHDKKQGGYHCHWGMFAGQKFSSKSEMLRQPRSGRQLGERAAQYRTVRQVVGGDALVLENHERVHLIGVDAPETEHSNKPDEHYGREATAFTNWMVQGKRVKLEHDEANAHLGHKDRYRRTLVYVFLEDGTFLNAEIIKQGFGFAHTRSSFKYLDDFRRYQQEAREQGKGLWAKFTVPPPAADSAAQASRGNLTKEPRSPVFVRGIYRTRHSTFVHSQPRRYSLKIFKLDRGTTVNVVGIHGDWLRINSKHGKMPGFIRKEALIP